MCDENYLLGGCIRSGAPSDELWGRSKQRARFCLFFFFFQTLLSTIVYEHCCLLKNWRPFTDNNHLKALVIFWAITDLKYHKPGQTRERLVDWFFLLQLLKHHLSGLPGLLLPSGQHGPCEISLSWRPETEPIQSEGTGRAELYAVGSTDWAAWQMPGQQVSGGGKGLILLSVLAEVPLPPRRAPQLCWFGPQRGTVNIHNCWAAAGLN